MTERTTIDKLFLNRLRRLGICEAISTLILFGIAVPLKYIGEMPLAVEIVGPVHGFLFVCLVVMFLVAVKKVPISSGLAFAGIVAAVFPFGPFLIDRKLADISVEE